MTLDYKNRNVTVIGLGIEGTDLARYFARHGAHVTVSDARGPEQLAARIAALDGLGITFALGGNKPEHVEGADLVCVSQGVPQSNLAVVAARERRIRVESMTTLFLDNFPGPVVGITGSSGKTTTTSLVDAIFSAANEPHLLGGNVGLGLMSLLDVVQSQEGWSEASDSPPWAVLEISHTQLVLTDRSPRVAALLRVTPNHLDQFTWDEYVALKKKIFEFQSASDTAIFNLDDPVSNQLRPDAKARQFLFSVERDPGTDGAFLRESTIFWRRDGRTEAVVPAGEVPMRGFHNVVNVTGATAIAAACDLGPAAVAKAVRSFRAPEHRLEFVAKVKGADYYNDSIATAPERTLAALRSFEEPIVLMLGGRDKKLPMDEMLNEMRLRCRAVVTFGESGPIFADAAERAGLHVQRSETLAEAVEAVSRVTVAGDVVLLSPAGTSFDAYDNFELRGADFRRLVKELERGHD